MVEMSKTGVLLGLAGLGVVAYMAKGNSSVAQIASTAVPEVTPNPEGLVWYGSDPSWSNWSAAAMCRFKRMGYSPAWMGAPLVPTGVNPTGHDIIRDSQCLKTYAPIVGVTNPASKNNILNALKTVPDIYYALAHGDAIAIQSGQGEWIYANDFYNAIPVPKVKGKFAFLGSCGVFDPVDEVKLDSLDTVTKTSMNALNSMLGVHVVPDAFIKAYEVVVGFTKIPEMSDWTVSWEFIDTALAQLELGDTVEHAFKYASGEVGNCPNPTIEMIGHYKIAGDGQVRLVESVVGGNNG
jgi:hypothetical protein